MNRIGSNWKLVRQRPPQKSPASAERIWGSWHIWGGRPPTIFGYISDTRLEEARRQIRDNPHGKTIAEIASISGYKNPQHFTVAFKKKYGVLPTSIN